MARRATFFGSAKTVAVTTAQTITFTSSEIDGAGVIGYFIGFGTAGNDYQDLDRVRVRAGSQILVDLTANELLAYNAAYSKANFNESAIGQQTIYIPLNLLDAPTDDARDACQFPPGAEPILEVVTLNTTVAGSMIVGWEVTDVDPEYFPRLISKTTTSPVSTRNNSLVFSDTGKIRAIVMPTAGVDRAELTVSGERAWSMPGAQFNAIAYGDLLSHKDADVFGIPISPPIGNKYACHSCDLGLAAASGASNLIFDTGAGWTANQEIAIYSVDTLENFHPSRGRFG
jgi:ABC-type cobalt transport system substrate-binding protein